MNRLFRYKKHRRVLFVLFTFLLVGSVRAEWVQLGRTDSFRIYLDQNSIQKNGDSAQILQLIDFTTAQWADAQTVVGSIKSLVEYDCSQPRFRTLAGEAYSERMGDGRVVANEPVNNPQWESVEPGSTPEKMRQIACGKRK
ncbi:surface-adhesin E family protein [Propionivibrio sp.]|uniref:surface-adhesin E family protein n=1 Tax=Propionivibrio sp. TaxID=2212460 RepID=UPI003BF27D73